MVLCWQIGCCSHKKIIILGSQSTDSHLIYNMTKLWVSDLSWSKLANDHPKWWWGIVYLRDSGVMEIWKHITNNSISNLIHFHILLETYCLFEIYSLEDRKWYSEMVWWYSLLIKRRKFNVFVFDIIKVELIVKVSTESKSQYDL